MWARSCADACLMVTAVGIPLSTSVMEGGVLGLIALTTVGLLSGWSVARRTPLDGVLLLFIGVLALSSLASGHLWEATGWPRLWVMSTYWMTAWWLRDRKHATRLVSVLLGAATVAAVYGIVQHFTGIDWYRALLGRTQRARPRVIGDTRFAVVGFFRNYLTFAHVMLFPLGWSAARASTGRLGAVAATVALVVAVVFSTARGAWLAMLALAAALAVTRGGRRGRVVVIGMVASMALAFAGSADLRSEAGRMFARTPENLGRLAIYAANLDIVRAHPLLGLGYGRYETAARPYYTAHPDADRRSHAHNNFLQIAAEAGLVGLAAFGLMFGVALWVGAGAVRHAADAQSWSTAAGAYVGVIGFLVGGLTQYNFGDNEVALALWFALAVLVRGADE